MQPISIALYKIEINNYEQSLLQFEINFNNFVIKIVRSQNTSAK